jgi:hypothetical protein
MCTTQKLYEAKLIFPDASEMLTDKHSVSVQFKLTAAHREQLKYALIDVRPGMSVTPRQRAVLIEICSGPEQFDHTPEQLLVAFKDGLNDAADHAEIPHGSDRDDLLARLVTAFIEELFRSPRRAFGALSESDDSERLSSHSR